MQNRKQKLTNPSIQIHLVGILVGASVVAMLLQFLYLGARLMGRIGEIDGQVGDLANEVPGLLLQTFVFSLVVLVPVMFGLGIVITARIVGPLRRFENHLREVACGEEVGPCRIRRTDQLHSLCEAINLVTEPLREIRGESDERKRAA